MGLPSDASLLRAGNQSRDHGPRFLKIAVKVVQDLLTSPIAMKETQANPNSPRILTLQISDGPQVNRPTLSGERSIVL